MTALGPVAASVRLDDLGAACAECLTSVYLDKIAAGRPVYRHVERKPPCLFDAKGKPRGGTM